jgi:hypothetical protein
LSGCCLGFCSWLVLPKSNNKIKFSIGRFPHVLPSREVLQAKLHQSIELARAKLDIKENKEAKSWK